MKPTTPTLYWGPILQAGCVIIITIDIAIDIDVHLIENHFQNLAKIYNLTKITYNRPFSKILKKSQKIYIPLLLLLASFDRVCKLDTSHSI